MRALALIAVLTATAVADIVRTDSETIHGQVVSIEANHLHVLIPGVGVRLFSKSEVRQVQLDDKHRANDIAAQLAGTGITVMVTPVATTPSPATADLVPVYVVKERNPGEAALYALIGVPGIAPLGQLYNGEMGKAEGFLAAKLVCLGLVGLSFLVETDTLPQGRMGTSPSDVLWGLGIGSYLAVSAASVADAAVSAERINRRMRGDRPALKAGLTMGF